MCCDKYSLANWNSESQEREQETSFEIARARIEDQWCKQRLLDDQEASEAWETAPVKHLVNKRN